MFDRLLQNEKKFSIKIHVFGYLTCGGNLIETLQKQIVSITRFPFWEISFEYHEKLRELRRRRRLLAI